ncbi:MAG TPA: hypothetical protein VN493_29010 [Thermoanaerobaculia bacterium]|nr:hypothetical protein [Thermoanaerobaculia bacterium]
MRSVSRRTLLAVLVATFVGAFLMPAEADPPCPYTAIKQTATMTGYGFTCTDATNDLTSKVQAEAEDDCSFLDGSVILTQLVITEECRAFSETQVQVTGYLKYRCMYCM